MTEGVQASETRVKEKVYRMLVRPAVMRQKDRRLS